MEAFFGAMEAGADAVYCGLKNFSARAKAKNFTLAEMENLCAYAHKHGRKLYIPLNTLIKEAELPLLIDTLEGIAHCHIDGLIIQDLGVYNLVQRFFPEIPLHASTQMAVHNRAGVQMLEKLGFERGVLARELTLTEIKAIRKDTTLELEHFIHGALCYSISGHCLFSSFQTGSSGNRGGCAQPCRRRYSKNNKSQFTFSTSDFSTLSHLPELAENGVMSFKIEGRMKNSEYVWNVVRAYREVLDCHADDISSAIRRGKAILAESHGRQTTSGFLSGKRKTILLPDQKGGIGKPAGQVEGTSGKSISFTSQTGLHIGDKLRIQPKTDQPGIAFVIREIKAGKKRSKQAKSGQFITVPTPFSNHFNPGDHIFKIATGRGFSLSEEACRRRLTTATLIPTTTDIRISCTQTILTVEATSPIHFSQNYEVETYPAQKSPLTLTTLENIFKKTATPELQLNNIQATNLPPVVIKPSRLKGIRREFYSELLTKLHQRQTCAAKTRIAISKATLKTKATTKTTSTPETPDILILTEYPHEDLLDTPHTLILPINTDKKLTDARQISPIWDIPAIIYNSQWQAVRKQIKDKQAGGSKKFRLNNISHFTLLDDTTSMQLLAGPALYCLNHLAAQTLRKLHIEAITTSLEDDKANLEALCTTTATVVPIYGTVTLMTSRIPISPTTISDTSTNHLHISQADGLTLVQAEKPFSLSGHLHELEQMGIKRYLVDLQGCSEDRRKHILRAIRRNEPIDSSSTFNYERGLT